MSEEKPEIREVNIEEESPEMRDRIASRMFEAEMGTATPVEVADYREEGGFKIEVHPGVLEDLEKLGITMEELLHLVRFIKKENHPDE